MWSYAENADISRFYQKTDETRMVRRCGSCRSTVKVGGETECKIADQFREHLNFTSKQLITKSTVAQHNNLPNHSYTDMQVIGLLHIMNTNYRKNYVEKLIQKL